MRIWLSLLTCVVLLAPPAAQCHAAAQGAENRVTGLYFRNAEVSKVLSALARIAHANIVLPEGDNTKITATLNNVTVDEAVRTVAVQAGLAYRRIGNTFVVAKFEDMPRVLAQEGVSEQVEVANADPAAVAKELQSAIPFLTVHTVGRTLSLVGAPEDINQAKKLLQSLDVPPTSSVPTETATVALTNVKATDVQNVLNNSFGKGVAQAVGDTKLVITAPESDLPRIQELVKTLDTGTEASLRYVVYHVKYSSARSLSVSLRTAMQNITVVSGPEQFHIPKTELNLVTGNAINITGTNGNTGAGGLGGSSSGLGGGSSGLGGGLGGTSGGMNTGETGLNDQSGYGGVGGLGGANQQQNGIRSRTLIIGGTDATVQAALQLLDKLDVPTPQVALDVKVVSTNPQTTQNLGIEWANGVNGNPGQLSTQVLEGPNGANPGFPNPVSGSPNPNINGLNLRNVFGFGSLGRLPITFSATLNAFFQRTDVRILAKPTITALDNEEGVIFVGQTNRVRVSAVTPGSNNIVVNTLIEIPIGIILQMTPRVIDDEMIQLRVHPIVSSVSGVVAADGLFNSLVREADTTVRVKSGETIVIGGLLQDEDTKTLDKIPILGDLPLIGQLFRNHSHTHNRQEVLVFVTPHLVKE